MDKIKIVTKAQKVILDTLADRELSFIEICDLLPQYLINVIGNILRTLISNNLILKKGNTYIRNIKNYKTGTAHEISVQDAEIVFEDKPIERYYPDTLTKMNVLRLLRDGLTRTEISKQLKLTKMQVLWTLDAIGERKSDTAQTDALFCTEDQYRAYKALDRPYKYFYQLTNRLNMTAAQIYKLMEELTELNAIVTKRKGNEKIFLQLDVNLIPQKGVKTNEN